MTERNIYTIIFGYLLSFMGEWKLSSISAAPAAQDILGHFHGRKTGRALYF